MNLNTEKKVNWSNIIILPEFYNYLELEELKEVSLISKLIRYNLKPTLFTNIGLNDYEFDNYFHNGKNLIYGYFEYRLYCRENGTNEGFDTTPYKNLKIEPALKEFEDQFTDFKPFVKTFARSGAIRLNYYMIPMLSMFDNLTSLNFDYCMINLEKFDKLINSLKKINTIELNDSEFVMLENENFTIDEVKFPLTLEKLTIDDCKMGVNKIDEPSDFLFSEDSNYISLGDFLFPKTPIPSLKSLGFKITGNDRNGASQFLEKNPQLEHLEFELSQLDQFLVNYIEKSNFLKKLELVSDRDLVHQIDIPTLNSIKKIDIELYNLEAYCTLEKLCLQCPNLNELSILISAPDLNNLTVYINNIQNNITSKSHNLKVLNLAILENLEDFINYKNLSLIEELTINSYYDNIINIQFNKFKSLKKFKFYLADYGIFDDFEFKYNISDVKIKFQQFSDWRFIFDNETVKGYKI